MKDDEAIVWEFATQLRRDHHVDDAIYARALEKFGENGMMDLVAVNGYYDVVSMTLNVAQVAPPSRCAIAVQSGRPLIQIGTVAARLPAARRYFESNVMKKIRLNAFAMNCVAHQSPGLWTHPRDRTAEYNRLPYWIDLRKTLERGRFDGLFLADVLGVYDVFGDSPDAALRNATQTPANDPLLLISAMAAVTEHLGFGVTSNLSFEPPYTFARRMSTLDHLTEGRIGWNVVTGYLDSAARGVGKDKQTAHDDRYDIADEYMEVVYKLWEGSWEDDAALRDRARGIFADPAKVHRDQARGRKLPARCASISASRRLSARRCCTRPAPRRAAGNSPRSMPNACSCRARRPR